MRPRIATLAATAALLGLILATLVGGPVSTEAASLGLRFPAPAGTRWTVASGYNTATHLGVDPYALDLVRADGVPTAGTPVLAPVSGTLSGGGTGDCAWIRADTVTVLICHIITDAAIPRGTRIFQGQRIGVVAPEGQKGNNGLAHIHLAVNVGGTSGTSLPFDGDYTLDGVPLPATTEPNAYSGAVTFTSTNDPALAALQVTAGEDQLVDPRQRVTLTADSATGTSYSWTQVSGPTVALTRSGKTATFTAPDSPGAVLQFQVSATGPSGVGVDTVEVRVRGVAPIPVAQRGRIVSGIVQADGLSLVMFGGGTNAELVTGAACGTTSATFWVTVAGRFIGYIPAALVPAVNAEWNAQFPTAIPANTPMVVRCR
ncbi:MAG: hypothetical protein EPO16_01270 [Dehalococcoidia bacterium]|nr:MAG: hypothetical protein EPO16_01270 [Dehalococcoidia bacterium]